MKSTFIWDSISAKIVLSPRMVICWCRWCRKKGTIFYPWLFCLLHFHFFVDPIFAWQSGIESLSCFKTIGLTHISISCIPDASLNPRWIKTCQYPHFWSELLLSCKSTNLSLFCCLPWPSKNATTTVKFSMTCFWCCFYTSHLLCWPSFLSSMIATS